MNRLARWAVLVVCASSFACGGAAPMLDWPHDCFPKKGASISVAVDMDANVPGTSECIVLDKSATVVWKGSDEVKELLIRWERQSLGCRAPLKDQPVCPAGTKECTFNSTGAQGSEVPLCYSVVVLTTAGELRMVDPRLIIQK